MNALEQALLAQVQQHQRAGEVAQAEAICTQLVRDFPHYAEGWNHLGILSFQAGKAQVSLSCFDRAVAAAPNVAGFHSNRGAVLQSVGRRDEAEAEFRESLRLNPEQSGAHNNLGNILRELGRSADAEACYRRALELNPNAADAHNNYGALLWDRGRFAEAAASCRHALELRPAYPEAYNNLGNALRDLGQYVEAERCYRRCLELRPDYPEAYNNLGNVLRDLERYEEAIACYRRMLRSQPMNAEAHNNLGSALRAVGNLAEAEASCRRGLELKPSHALGHNNLGNVLLDQNRLEEAEICYRRALELNPNSAEGHNNHGNVQARLGLAADAVLSYRRALELKPVYVEAMTNLGAALWDLGQCEEATVCYQQALELKPGHAEAHYNFAHLLLGTGDCARGWSEYEWRWQFRDGRLPTYRQPLWDRSSPAGRTILIHAEQGLGDTLQFIRYARFIKERGATVLFHCPATLLDVLRSCAGIDRLVPLGSAPPPFDVHVPLLSLPRLLGTTVDSIPASIPYLEAERKLVDRWREELKASTEFKVGIVWQGAAGYRKDRQRSVSLNRFVPLANIAGVRLFSLQVGLGREQLNEHVTDLGGRFDPASFRDAAAAVKCMDLVISVDTSLVHLAGALGVPTWVALPFSADWRWMRERTDTPWYPTLRLFRQPRPGDWDAVFVQIKNELAARVRSRR